MKRIIPFILVLAACGKSADKPKDELTPAINPTVSIIASYEATAGGTRNGTGFDIKIDSATNFKRIAYIRLMNESGEVGVDAVIRPMQVSMLWQNISMLIQLIQKLTTCL